MAPVCNTLDNTASISTTILLNPSPLHSHPRHLFQKGRTSKQLLDLSLGQEVYFWQSSGRAALDISDLGIPKIMSSHLGLCSCRWPPPKCKDSAVST